MAKKKSNVPANETKAQKFVRLANFRVNKLLKSFKQLGQLGGNGYESTADQRKKIETILKDSLERAIGQMNKAPVASQEFKL